MAGRPSSIGFGFQPFGQFPFGSADWAEEVTWAILPQFYRDEDAKSEAEPTEPLRKYIDSVKPQFQFIRDKWEQFPDLWDAQNVPIDQLENLGYNFDTFPSDVKSDALRRTEVLNAIRFFLNKGTDRGYRIAASLSGFDVTVTPYWADDCADPAANLSTSGPTEFFPRFDTFPADVIPTDLTFDDFYEKWPGRLDWITPCRTSYIDLHFTSPTDEEIENFSEIAEDVLSNVERVRPIHVRINTLRFEGPAATAGGWTIPVAVTNSATAGGWTIPVTAELRTSGGGWTIPVVATPTP